MLGWIEKVVPQPPVSSPIKAVAEKETKAEQTVTEARPGPARQLPEGCANKPAEGPKREASVGTQEAVSTTESAGHGVLTWLSHGLGKVMPQPTQNSIVLQEVKKSFEASIEIPDVTEVQSIHDEDGLDTTAFEPKEEEGDCSELQSSSDNNAPDKIGGRRVLTWLKVGIGKMMPQPENTKKAEERTTEEPISEKAISKANNRGTPCTGNFPANPPATAVTKHRVSTDSQSGLSISLFPRTLGGDGSSAFEWFVQGLEKVIPQPVSKAKQDGQQSMAAAGLGPGQERSKGA